MTHPVYYPIEDSTLPIFFSTYDGGDGSSITLTGLAVTDIEVYKGTSMTQRSSDSGFSLLDTDGIDIDTRTGIHGFSIDLSDNTDAGFYAVDSWYHVVVDAITVDAVTVRFIAAAFRIVSATRGMAGTALPDAAADAAGGLPISDAGGLDLDGLDTNVSTVLSRIGAFTGSGVNTILGFFKAVMRSDASNPSDVGGTYNAATDSLEGSDIDRASLSSGISGLQTQLEGLIGFYDYTVGTVGNDTTHVHLVDIGTYGDDDLNDRLLVIYHTATAEYHCRWITDWVDSTNLATVETLPFTPSSSDRYWVTNLIKVSAQTIRDAMKLAPGAGIPGTGSVDEHLDDIYASVASSPSAGIIADAVLDELISEHSIAGSLSEVIDNIEVALGTAGAGLTDLGGMSTAMKAQVNAEMLDVLTTDTFAEPSSVPAATSSIKDKLNWLFALARNKITQTSTTQTLRNDADAANIGTSTVSDDGTTATRGEWS